MESITRKPIVRELVAKCLEAYNQKGVDACASAIYEHLLCAKVKFPLLEFAGISLFKSVEDKDHIRLTDEIESYKTEGGNVLLGIMLQIKLATHFEESIEKAVEYISKGTIWYVADIIGERVYGYALLHWPTETLEELSEIGKHPNNLVVRSLGAGAHYAVKKGLPTEYVKPLFQFLLTLATAQDHQIRQGIGWAAKTTAKFHPALIADFQKELDDDELVDNWFRKKVNIGLEKHQHAQRNKR